MIEALEESFHEDDDSHTRQIAKRHESTICGFGTDRLFNFRRHLKVHLEAENEQLSLANHMCSHCGKTFMSTSGPTRHTQNKRPTCHGSLT